MPNNLFYKEQSDKGLDDFKFLLRKRIVDKDGEPIMLQDWDDDTKWVRLTPYHFLHGYCEHFSFRLLVDYGLERYSFFNPADQERFVHAFNIAVYDGVKYYVDIRGATADFREFAKEFMNEDQIPDDPSEVIRPYNGLHTPYLQVQKEFLDAFFDRYGEDLFTVAGHDITSEEYLDASHNL